MQWEKLTAPDFAKAVEDTQGVCLLPLPCVEKHGEHLPLGTDLFIGMEICRRAAEIEPASDMMNAAEPIRPKSSAPRRTLPTATTTPSTGPASAMASIVAMFAKPGFIHGIGRGNNSSTDQIAVPTAIKSAQIAMRRFLSRRSIESLSTLDDYRDIAGDADYRRPGSRYCAGRDAYPLRAARLDRRYRTVRNGNRHRADSRIEGEGRIDIQRKLRHALAAIINNSDIARIAASNERKRRQRQRKENRQNVPKYGFQMRRFHAPSISTFRPHFSQRPSADMPRTRVE